MVLIFFFVFFFQAEDGIRDRDVTGVQTCALPIYLGGAATWTWCLPHAIFGYRYRHRHIERDADRSVPKIRPGGGVDHASVRWHRVGSRRRQTAGRTDGWRNRCREHPRSGEPVLVRDSARERRQPDDRPRGATRKARTAPRPDRR